MHGLPVLGSNGVVVVDEGKAAFRPIDSILQGWRSLIETSLDALGCEVLGAFGSPPRHVLSQNGYGVELLLRV
eukprot:11158741-Lingulodinium_polyedra.AAC.1